jgi:hypothetical protein
LVFAASTPNDWFADAGGVYQSRINRINHK